MERNETKHTPGPWCLQRTPNDLDCSHDVAPVGGDSICSVYRGHEADARLIAAAPTLLEVLQDAGRALAADTSESSLAQRIRAAIALATGAH
jgi:hypothetical protein